MSFNVGPVHRRVPHLMADLIELLLVVGYDGCTHLSKQSAEALISASQIHAEEADDAEREEEEDVADAEKNDRISVAMEDAWKILIYRDNFFGDAYPFDVDGQTIRPSSEITEGGRIYRFLLACSRLRSFVGTRRAAWAKGFSYLSAFALRQGLPNKANVRVFDANSDDRKKFYSTDLREALKILGKDLHALSINEVECDKQSSSGDATIDIVAAYPFEDGASGTIAALGQCAAREKEWPSKRFEGHPDTLRAFYQLTHDPLHFTFIPLSYRLSTGEWVQGSKVTGTVVLDRGRILNLVLISDDCTEILESEWFRGFEDCLPLTVA
ncbi:MAG: hypothetical protein LBE51_06800 [Acidovorax sp.]|jgi:hypothetical protein|nr:hypothetical protein [Acidovorax sp.]